ncbi:MAG: ArsR family transcriptional regulator [Candidatus Rokubacteria bacterium]|nr:ArsR family transcriptional regulator [Candidatus Rokubacteria bacterium]
MLVARSSPFGGKTRTRVLLALGLLSESYPRELARVLDASLYGVQEALKGLEVDGIVSGRNAGRTRLFRLNPLYFASEELRRYLLRLVEPEVELKKRVEDLRRRPRRTGKPL